MGKKSPTLQCDYCKVKFPREELIQVNKSTKCCSDCKETKRKEMEEYKELIKYICDGYKIKKPTGHQTKSIKRLKEMGYTYKEIQYTIYYIYFIENKRVSGNVVDLVPFFAEKANKHRELIGNAKKTAKKLATTEVVIKSNYNKKPNVGKTRLINIDELF